VDDERLFALAGSHEPNDPDKIPCEVLRDDWEMLPNLPNKP
jgi:hypothetical protein